MPSVFTLPPTEEGGPIARKGFTYQDHIAVAFCLEMLQESTIKAVWCETHDDLVLERLQDGQLIAEFIQVKSHALSQLWSIAKLCAGDDGTSIIERQLAHDRGDEFSFFRVVTRQGVSGSLALLEQPVRARGDSERLALLAELEIRLPTCRSPKRNGVAYWLDHVRWEVRESAAAVANKNLILLEEVLEQYWGRILLLEQRKKLYQRLLDAVRIAAEQQWQEGSRAKRIAHSHVYTILDSELANFSTAAAKNVLDELRTLERESIARCEDRWAALGVDVQEAAHLAQDSTVGLRKELRDLVLKQPFTWLVGAFGSGKSLAAERLFQSLLTECLQGQIAAVPIFLEAKRLTRSLREEVELRLERLPSLAGHRQKTVVILDGVDEAGTHAAADLLSQCNVLARTRPRTSVLALSTELPGGSYPDARVSLPPLSKEETLFIIENIAGQEWHSLVRLPTPLREDAAIPLFAVLIALHLREHADLPTSAAELIAEVAERALRPLSIAYEQSLSTLARLAAQSTHLNGAPVPETELAASIVELRPLLETRLIIRDQRKFSFSVPTIAHWFAAQSLSLGIVQPEEILSQSTRLAAWQTPLAIFVGSRRSPEIAAFLEPLAARFPVTAALVLNDAVTFWPRPSTGSAGKPLELGMEVLRAIRAWGNGLGPLANRILPLTETGELLKLEVYGDADELTLVWSDAPGAPELRERSEPFQICDQHISPSSGFRSVWSICADSPARIWSELQRHFAGELRNLINQRGLMPSSGPIVYEQIWQAACRFKATPTSRPARIPLEAFRRSRPSYNSHYSDRLLRSELDRLEAAGEKELLAPYPQEDLPSSSEWSFGDVEFSPTQKLARARAVYDAALIAYKQLAEEFLPLFGPRLGWFASLPVRLVGIVAATPEGSNSKQWPFTYCRHVLPSGSLNQVDLTLGDNDAALECIRHSRQDLDEIQRSRPDAAAWLGSSFGQGQLRIFSPTPATEIAYKWLEDDLRNAAWI